MAVKTADDHTPPLWPVPALFALAAALGVLGRALRVVAPVVAATGDDALAEF